MTLEEIGDQIARFEVSKEYDYHDMIRLLNLLEAIYGEIRKLSNTQ